MNSSTRKWIFAVFLVYGVALFLCLTVYRLPSEKLLQRGVNQFTEGKVILKAERISATFPPGYRLENVEYSILLTGDFYKNNLKFLNIYPNYLGLLEGYFPVTMKGLLPRGDFEIEAGASILKGSKDVFIAFKASDAYLEDLGFLKLLTGRTLKGKVKAEVNLKGNLTDYTRIHGDGRLSLEEGSLESQVQFFGLKEIPFKNLRISFTVKEGLLSLKEVELAGPVFSGRISGDIRLKKPLEQSLLHLTARLTPGSGLPENEGTTPVPAGKDGLMVVRMEGMLRNPHVSWSQ
jgi:type II secretion system protein N